MEVHSHSELLVQNDNFLLLSLWLVNHFLKIKKIPLDVEYEFPFWYELTKILKNMFQLANENQEM